MTCLQQGLSSVVVIQLIDPNARHFQMIKSKETSYPKSADHK